MPLEILEPISGKNQVRMRIDESRHYNAPTGIHDFRVGNIPFELIARTDFLNLPVTDEHSAIANNPELRQLCPNTLALRSSQRNELRRVQDGE